MLSSTSSVLFSHLYLRKLGYAQRYVCFCIVVLRASRRDMESCRVSIAVLEFPEKGLRRLFLLGQELEVLSMIIKL